MGSRANEVISVDAIKDTIDKFSLAEDTVIKPTDAICTREEERNSEPATMKSWECRTPSSIITSSFHTPWKTEGLVSSMKGAREKLGAPPRKMSVTWSPEVYDPVPNSMSHTVKGKMKSKKDKHKDKNRGKKNKKGQKSNVSKGSKVKDKIQAHNPGGRVERFDHNSSDFIDLNVDSPDFCGSSFLKEPQTKFQFLLC